MYRKSILAPEFSRATKQAVQNISQNSRFSHTTYRVYYVLQLYKGPITSVEKKKKTTVHCLGTLLWKWPICVSVCVYWVCLCVCTYGTRVCKLEHSVSTGIVRWHHVCLSERRGEGRRGSWFAWGRERLDCVYSLPALQADSSRDTAGRPRAAERQRQEGKREGRKREQERVGARKRARGHQVQPLQEIWLQSQH